VHGDLPREVPHFRCFLGSGANGQLTPSLYDEHQRGHNEQPPKKGVALMKREEVRGDESDLANEE
jgi:hypothetical protein